jgi:hypothetical protein
MEKEKSKSKSHPFAGYLNPMEEVLWMSAPSQPSTAKQQLLAMGAILVGVVMMLLVGVVSDKTPLFEKFAIVMTVSIIAGIAILVVFGVMWVFKRLTRSTLPEHAYAITNERLLYRNKKHVSSIPLENLPAVSLFLGNGDKGTFSFGALFPMWPDIEDAIRIKHLIDDAQKKRMQRL